MREPIDTYMNTLVPMVVEQTNRGEPQFPVVLIWLRNGARMVTI